MHQEHRSCVLTYILQRDKQVYTPIELELGGSSQRLIPFCRRYEQRLLMRHQTLIEEPAMILANVLRAFRTLIIESQKAKREMQRRFPSLWFE